MKLVLKNFRCYSSKTFEFEDDTTTLISGPSGQGKTTILLAIQFALYGLPNHKYLISHTMASCEVILFYKNFKIKRTRKPNILNVNMDGVEYEDKEAQSIINKYFGLINSAVFFMDLSHTEKMQFLEKIVNGEYDVNDLKNKIKIKLSELSKEIATLDGQISTTENMLQIIQKPEKVEKPNPITFFGDKEPSSYEDLILWRQSIIKQLDNVRIIQCEFERLCTEQNLIQSELGGYQNLNLNVESDIKKETENMEDLTNKNNYWNTIKSKNLMVEETRKELKKYEDLTEDLNKLKIDLERITNIINVCTRHKKLHELFQIKQKYETALKLEKTEWLERKTFLTTQINNFSVPKEDLSSLEQILQRVRDCKTFNSQYNIDDIRGQIEALKACFYKNYKCPMCNYYFYINMNTFELVNHNHKVNLPSYPEFQTIKSTLQKMELLYDQLKNNYEFLKNNNETRLQETIKLIKDFTQLKKELTKYDRFEPSKLVLFLEDSLKPLKVLQQEKVSGCENCENCENCDAIDELKDKKRDLTIKIDRLLIKDSLLSKIDNVESYDEKEHLNILWLIKTKNESLKGLYTELEKVKNFVRLNSRLNDIRCKIKKLNFNVDFKPQLEQTLLEIELGLKYHTKLQQYTNFNKELKKYKKVKDTLKMYFNSKINTERIYHKMCIFKQKVIESEHESLEGIVATINSHLAILLKEFFCESFGDPIDIYLELVSEKRPQVNTVINYRGHRVDYKSLSTGEIARVKLAFDLTFKEILGEQIIMLDECTANLDQELSTKIFNKIQSTFPSKTILVVAHQVVMGTFDHLLHL